jgi:recombination protein RecR
MPEVLRRLIAAIAYLPGVGEKTAVRLAFFILKAPGEYIDALVKAIVSVRNSLHECPRCHGYSDHERAECTLCLDDRRDEKTLCIVEDYLDMLALERLGAFKGRYHVLWGVISPLKWVRATDLTIAHLIERIAMEGFTEVILALDPTIEGEVTSLYVRERLEGLSIRLTKLSKGLPNAGAIEYADDVTLLNALKGRGAW